MSTVQTISPADRGSAPGHAPALAVLEQTRARTLALVAHLDTNALETVHSPIMGPLVWDLAHIAAYEDLWLCHRHFGLELLRPDLAALYDAFETPRPARQDADAGLLDSEQAYAYLAAVHARSCDALARTRIPDPTLFELVVRHELQHTETMRQTMNLAGLLAAGEPPALTVGGGGGVPVGGEQKSDGRARAYARAHATRNRARAGAWVEIPAGAFVMGAGPQGFAYDNERPRHTVELPAFEIASHPLTNATWQTFCEQDGYEDPQWWSDAGWAWLQRHASGRGRHDQPDVVRDDPQACLVHISWFEAEALAAASGGRLPTEAEWERAARTDLGDERALGALRDVGLVWEWTDTIFSGYPHFGAYPYREYSEVFFDRGYRVLRGSSWATDARVASSTFRNWDLPERQQIFAGVRLARDC